MQNSDEPVCRAKKCVHRNLFKFESKVYRFVYYYIFVAYF